MRKRSVFDRRSQAVPTSADSSFFHQCWDSNSQPRVIHSTRQHPHPPAQSTRSYLLPHNKRRRGSFFHQCWILTRNLDQSATPTPSGTCYRTRIRFRFSTSVRDREIHSTTAAPSQITRSRTPNDEGGSKLSFFLPFKLEIVRPELGYRHALLIDKGASFGLVATWRSSVGTHTYRHKVRAYY